MRNVDERFQILLDNLPIAYQSLDQDGNLLDVSRSWCDLLGYDKKEVIGRHFSEFQVLESSELFASCFARLRSEGKVFGIRCVLKKKDGAKINARVDGKVGYEQDGSFKQTHCVIHDITEEERVERALNLASDVVDNIPIGLHVYHLEDINDDSTLRMVAANSASSRILGVRCEDLLGKSLEQNIPKGIRENGLQQKYAEVVRTGKAVEIGDVHYGDGRVAPATLRVNAFPLPEQCVGVSFEDISEQRKAEGALRMSEDLLNRTGDIAQVGGWQIELSTKKVIWTRTTSRIHQVPDGYCPDVDEAINYYHPDDREIVRNCLNRAIEKAEPYEFEARLVTAKGIERWVRSCGQPIVQDGTIVSVSGTFQDVTERKETEEALRKEHDFVESLVNTAPVIIVVLGKEGQIVLSNRYFEELTGYTSEEIHGRDWFSTFLPHEDHDRLREVFRQALGDIDTSGTINPIVTKDSRECQIEWHNKTLKGPDGRVVGLLCVGTDISERMAMETRLRQAEKMRAIGQLAGGIAHDFNNVLGGILGYAEMTLDEVAEGSLIERNVLQIEKAGQRAMALVRQILAFSRQDEEEKSPVHLEPIVLEAVQLLRASLPSSVEIRLEISDDTKPVMADSVKIHGVLLNLCKNASDAMAEHGVLEIGLSTQSIDKPIAGLIGKILPGKYSVLEVKDTGCGMSDEALAHSFEPFYTTKEEGTGTGMGLAVVYGVVQSHGGDIVVESVKDLGTTFRIYLPITDEAVSEDDEEMSSIEGGTERILFVDDEETLGEMAFYMLSSLGYQVQTFSDSREALAEFAKSPSSFDLVITDLTMPNLSGLDLSKSILEQRADIDIILLTGFNKSVDEKTALAAGAKAFVLKPVSMKKLASTIRNVLDN